MLLFPKKQRFWQQKIIEAFTPYVYNIGISNNEFSETFQHFTTIPHFTDKTNIWTDIILSQCIKLRKMNLHSVNLNKRKKSLLCNFASPRKKADTAASTNAVAPCDNSAQWRLSSVVFAVLSQRCALVGCCRSGGGRETRCDSATTSTTRRSQLGELGGRVSGRKDTE